MDKTFPPMDITCALAVLTTFLMLLSEYKVMKESGWKVVNHNLIMLSFIKSIAQILCLLALQKSYIKICWNSDE